MASIAAITRSEKGSVVVTGGEVHTVGIEPTASTAKAARALGLDIVERFFGVELARELAAAGRQVDLVAANNVLAHVPDINDFVGGFTALLKPDGVATFEFPHLLRLLRENQFDTVYHEHYSYLSLGAVARVFESNGLAVFDAEELPTHGGSLRVYAQRRDAGLCNLPALAADERGTSGLGEFEVGAAMRQSQPCRSASSHPGARRAAARRRPRTTCPCT